MPPYLASTLTWAIVLGLLVWDYRRSPRTQPGLWVATLWILILASRSPAYWFQTGSGEISVDAYEEGNSLNQVIYLSIIAVGAVVLLGRRLDWTDILKRNRAIFAFLGFCVASAVWADYPLVSLKGAIKSVLGNLIMALIVTTDANPVAAIRAMLRRTAFVLVPTSVLVIKYYPTIGRQTHRYTYETMYQGVSEGGNGLAAMCYICSILIIWNLIRKGARADRAEFGLNIVMLSLIVWLFNKGDGGTAMLALTVGLTTLVLLQWQRLRHVPIALARRMDVFLAVVTPVLFLSYSSLLAGLATIGISSETLFGRLAMWKLLVTKSGNPLVGFGYGNFWLGSRMQQMWDVYSWHPTQAHNGYLETYLNLGIGGLILLAVLIVVTCRNATLPDLHPELRMLKLPYIVPALYYNLTEAAFRGLHPVWFVFLMFAFVTRQELTSASSPVVAAAEQTPKRLRPAAEWVFPRASSPATRRFAKFGMRMARR